MTIARKSEMKIVDGPEAYLTGKVTITGQFQHDDPSRVSGAIVHFEPGARSAWHTHPAGQTLVVTEGVSWTQIADGPKLEFKPATSSGARQTRSIGTALRRIKA